MAVLQLAKSKSFSKACQFVFAQLASILKLTDREDTEPDLWANLILRLKYCNERNFTQGYRTWLTFKLAQKLIDA